MAPKAKDMMHGITVVEGDLAVREVAKIMREKTIGSVLVEEDGEVKGILTERDIIKKVVAEGLSPGEVKASEVMSKPLKTVEAGADIYEISALFNEHYIRRLPVTENGRIIGVLTTRNVAKSLISPHFKSLPFYKGFKL